MTKKTIHGLVLVVLGMAVAAAADVVILQNGDRIEGEIVSDTPAEVLIKRSYKTGGIKYTDKIERSRIARVEKGQTEPAESTPSAAQSKPSASQPAPLTDAERKDLLKTALGHWEKQEYAGVGPILSKLINGSTKVELNRMSKEVENQISISLGDMAAEAHLQAAIARAKGQGVVLSYVTEYEKPFLVPRLIDEYDKALKEPFSAQPAAVKPAPKPVTKQPKGKTTGHGKAGEQPAPAPQPETPPASQPAGKQFVLAELMEKEGSLEGLTTEERTAVSRQIRFASSLLLARIRYDGEYKTNTEVKNDIEAKKKQLATLQKELSGKSSEAASGKENKSRPTTGGMGGGAHEKGGPGAGGHGPGGDQRMDDKDARPVQKMLNKIKRENQEGGPDMQNENENPNQ